MFNQQSSENEVYAIDINPEAVKCARLNSQIVDVANNYNAQEMDFASLKDEEITKKFDSWHFP